MQVWVWVAIWFWFGLAPTCEIQRPGRARVRVRVRVRVLKFDSTTWTLKVEIWDPLSLGELLATETEPSMVGTKKSSLVKK